MNTDKSKLTAFSGNAKLSAWAKNSVAGAANAGILQGTPNNKIAPSSKATRVEAVVMLNRFLQYIS
ncbi:S-layer homology domain-containing protein [Paenibacillus segetis]|uniref:SLH domain-containing protein n=1 Tax=Paenibacillus segetis TaxID=1325360 RepID=A0ABQ1YTQ9_9BACL|nr:S-layer homology domain-containing protein [Paenibacillus segetis]GGH35853.1 hypothetical protein GCM10008013_42410 [Paenibacillus segetis]